MEREIVNEIHTKNRCARTNINIRMRWMKTGVADVMLTSTIRKIHVVGWKELHPQRDVSRAKKKEKQTEKVMNKKENNKQPKEEKNNFRDIVNTRKRKGETNICGGDNLSTVKQGERAN